MMPALSDKLKEHYENVLYERLRPQLPFFEVEPIKLTRWQRTTRRLDRFAYRLRRAWKVLLDREAE